MNYFNYNRFIYDQPGVTKTDIKNLVLKYFNNCRILINEGSDSIYNVPVGMVFITIEDEVPSITTVLKFIKHIFKVRKFYKELKEKKPMGMGIKVFLLGKEF